MSCLKPIIILSSALWTQKRSFWVAFLKLGVLLSTCLLIASSLVFYWYQWAAEFRAVEILFLSWMPFFFFHLVSLRAVPSVDTSFLPNELTTNVASKRREKMASLNAMAVTAGRKSRQAMCGQKPDIRVLLSDHNFISSSLVLFPSSFLFLFSNNIIFTKL